MMNRRQMGGAMLAAGAAAALPVRASGGIWDASGNVRRAGGVLHWRSIGVQGALPPLVLLHMLGGWSDDWRDVARILGKDRRVIAFDLPGHGLSHWDGAPPQVQSVQETAGLIAGALTELGIVQADFAGMSLGGCVAVALAAAMPERVRRLVLPSCALGKGRSWAEVVAREADQVRTGMFSADGDPLPTGPNVLRKVFGLRDAERIAAEQNASRKAAGRWIRPQERGVGLTDFTVLLGRILAPVLLIYGGRDTFFPPFRPMAEGALRDHRTVVLEQSGGFPVQDDPVPTAAVIAQFLAG